MNLAHPHAPKTLEIEGKSRDIYEQGVVKPVPSRSSGQALSLSKGRSWDFFAGSPHIYSASPLRGASRLRTSRLQSP
jgi:hypothetical protein